MNQLLTSLHYLLFPTWFKTWMPPQINNYLHSGWIRALWCRLAKSVPVMNRMCCAFLVYLYKPRVTKWVWPGGGVASKIQWNGWGFGVGGVDGCWQQKCKEWLICEKFTEGHPSREFCYKPQGKLNYGKINCYAALSQSICMVFDLLLG